MKNTNTLDSVKIANFIKDMNAKDFVELHQKTVKTDISSRRFVELFSAELLEEIDLFDTIAQQYRNFLFDLGTDKACDWLADKIKVSRKYVEYEIGLIDQYDDNDEDECDDEFTRLHLEPVSRRGLDAFMTDLIRKMK